MCKGCCSVPLQRRAKIAATVDMILASLNIVFSSLDLRKTSKIEDEADTEEERNEARLSRYLILIVIVISVIKLIMGYVLWVGAEKRLTSYVRSWLIISIILWIIHLSDYIAKLAKGAFLIFTTVTTGLAIVVRVLVFFVVTMFIREMEQDKSRVPESGTMI